MHDLVTFMTGALNERRFKEIISCLDTKLYQDITITNKSQTQRGNKQPERTCYAVRNKSTACISEQYPAASHDMITNTNLNLVIHNKNTFFQIILHKKIAIKNLMTHHRRTIHTIQPPRHSGSTRRLSLRRRSRRPSKRRSRIRIRRGVIPGRTGHSHPVGIRTSALGLQSSQLGATSGDGVVDFGGRLLGGLGVLL